MLAFILAMILIPIIIFVVIVIGRIVMPPVGAVLAKAAFHADQHIKNNKK